DSDYYVRNAAAQLFLNYGAADKEAVDLLADALGPTQPDPYQQRTVITIALGRIGPAALKGVEPLKRLLTDNNQFLRTEAANALGWIGPAAESATQPLLDNLSHPFANIRTAAAQALARIDPTGKNLILPLQSRLQNHNPARLGAVQTLAYLGPT